ncbi:hypothetical protein BKA64DRAFT_168936 [Cadophora sp. MPI-SDFR-AT-0126]|nr:hypothetical protein BKA64DRAFT_168936 [Leotiomycetes sp. MPI-SDFR-AT-0126]
MLPYPLIDGNGADRGIWDPKNNDLAWQVLLPSLKLASMILAHLHTHPWLDTLLLGKEEPFDASRFPPPSLNQVNTPQHLKFTMSSEFVSQVQARPKNALRHSKNCNAGPRYTISKLELSTITRGIWARIIIRTTWPMGMPPGSMTKVEIDARFTSHMRDLSYSCSINYLTQIACA